MASSFAAKGPRRPRSSFATRRLKAASVSSRPPIKIAWVRARCWRFTLPPEGLEYLAIRVDGKLLSERSRNEHWGGTFSLRTGVGTSLGAAGRHRLTAEARWTGGRSGQSSIEVVYDPELRAARRGIGVVCGGAALLWPRAGRAALELGARR